MKIIAKGADNKFFCEVSIRELSAILGRDSNDLTHGYLDIKLGETVDLTELIECATWIKNLDEVHLSQLTKDLERVKKSVQKLNLINTLSTDVKPYKPPVVNDNDDDLPF